MSQICDFVGAVFADRDMASLVLVLYPLRSGLVLPGTQRIDGSDTRLSNIEDKMDELIDVVNILIV